MISPVIQGFYSLYKYLLIIRIETESSESDDNKAQMFVLKAGDKRGVVKKVKSPSKSK